jgi:integrase
MPKPFRIQSTRDLPANAEITEHDGKPHVRMRERGRTVQFPLTKDGKKYLRPSKCWYFEYKDAAGTVRRLKGFTDLKATEQLAAETERKASRLEVGLIDPHARRPLAAHLTDYTAHLEAKGDTAEHVKHTAGRLTTLFDGCGFTVAAEIDAGKVAGWLNALRRGGEPVALPAGVDAFAPAQAAAALGVSPTAVSAAVRRMGLPPATGNGKARRYPRASVEALAANRAKGSGPETVNHYIRAAKGFTRWMVRTGRMATDPLAPLALVSAKADVRRGRRELTPDELRRLFAAARTSAVSLRGLSGGDRAALYSLAAGTGFRVNALANLTPADFDFPAGTVTLPARFNKSRKVKVQPLPPDVAAAIATYAAGRPAGELLWGGTWAERAADMIRADLEAAGIPYSVPGPDGPRFADFHALRHSYLTMLGRSGVDLRTAQELAGHSSPVLTARYSHRDLTDLVGAVGKLPELMPGAAGGAERRVVPGVVTGSVPGHSPAPSCTPTGVDDTGASVSESLEMKAGGARKHRPASARTSGASGIRTQNQGIMSPLL